MMSYLIEEVEDYGCYATVEVVPVHKHQITEILEPGNGEIAGPYRLASFLPEYSWGEKGVEET